MRDIWKISKQVTQYHIGVYLYFARRCFTCNIKATAKVVNFVAKWLNLYPTTVLQVAFLWIVHVNCPVNISVFCAYVRQNKSYYYFDQASEASYITDLMEYWKSIPSQAIMVRRFFCYKTVPRNYRELKKSSILFLNPLKYWWATNPIWREKWLGTLHIITANCIAIKSSSKRGWL